MPTYEYQCQQCGQHVEIFQNMEDMPLTECPQCGGIFQRLITGGSGFLVKGRGSSRHDDKQNTCCSRGESCEHPKRCCEN